MATPGKTVRFAAIVKKAGLPVNYLLWSDPKKDPKFKRALADHLVMTVHREMRGAHKDHGEVGYQPDRHAQFLLFPKSLRRFEEKRVVGIDYGLLAGHVASSGSPFPSATLSRPKPKVEPAPKLAGPPATHNVLHFPESETPAAMEKATKVDRTEKIEKAEKMVKMETPAKLTMPRIKRTARLDPETAGQIRQAVRELKTGKYVKAYTRLNALLGPRG